jgi:hypothetical protein
MEDARRLGSSDGVGSFVMARAPNKRGEEVEAKTAFLLNEVVARGNDRSISFQEDDTANEELCSRF